MRLKGTEPRRESKVRVSRFIGACAALLPIVVLAGQEGRFCTIPKLVPGIPAYVSMESINEPFCGVALIDGHYKRLSEIISRQIEGPIQCVSSSSCQKTVQYFSRVDDQAAPYIIIFSGPRTSPGA